MKTTNKVLFTLLMAIVMMTLSPTKVWADSNWGIDLNGIRILVDGSAQLHLNQGDKLRVYIDYNEYSWGGDDDELYAASDEYALCDEIDFASNGRHSYRYGEDGLNPYARNSSITIKETGDYIIELYDTHIFTYVNRWEQFDMDDGSSTWIEETLFDYAAAKVKIHKITHYDAVPGPNCQTAGTIEHWSCDGCHSNWANGGVSLNNLDFYSGHNYVNHECTLCGKLEDGYMFGYVGTDVDGKNIRWELNNNTHVLTFSGTGEMEAFDLAHNAWRNENKTTVTKVIIGEGITNIGDGAYPDGYFIEMSGLTEVVLPSTLKTIGSSGFQDCVNLTSITLPEGLETIKANGIRNCKKITSITLPSSLTSIGSTAFADCSGLRDMYIAGSEPIITANDAFSYINRGNITLHVNGDLYDWAKATAPWSGFNIPRPYNIAYTDAEGESYEMKFDTNAADNTFTITDGAYKNLTIKEDIPMQTLTYTRNFSAANTWQALYVPFEMAYSDWASKFDVATICNFHEYANANGETEKVELEVRYVKNGKLLPNIPYLIRAKAAGECTITLNNVTLKATETRSIGCSSTERKYTFAGTYDAIDQLRTKNYIFLSGGRLCKANNDTDILKPMRWYLTIEDYFSTTSNPSAALSKPMEICVIGDDDELTGVEELNVVSSPVEAVASGIYSISGVKLAKPQQGINIINGKKVNVK